MRTTDFTPGGEDFSFCDVYCPHSADKALAIPCLVDLPRAALSLDLGRL
jgi:hypothetical protein